jgi:hypothetical protein
MGTPSCGGNGQSRLGQAHRLRFRPSVFSVAHGCRCKCTRLREFVSSMRVLVPHFPTPESVSWPAALCSLARFTFLKTASKLPKRATIASPSKNSFPSIRSSKKIGAPSSFYRIIYIVGLHKHGHAGAFEKITRGHPYPCANEIAYCPHAHTDLEFFEAASHLDTVGSYRKELLVKWVALNGLEVSVESTEKCWKLQAL